MSRNRSGHPRWLGWGIGVTTAVLLLLTGYAALFSGDDEPSRTSDRPAAAATDASPAPTYGTPPDWTEPERWAALPRAARTDVQGNEVGFPQTAEGAVAMLVAANTTEVKAGHSHVDVQHGVYGSYLIPGDRTEENKGKIERAAAESDTKVRRSMGLPENDDLPPGAYSRNHVVGFRVIDASPSEVTVWLLSRATVRTGETGKEEGAYTSLLAAAEWSDGDWWLSAASTENAIRHHGREQHPAIAAPGDAAFNTARWTAIRAAS
ncbi:hypothetical protein V5N34_36615 [Streptomyces baarnensis]|uniref:hypothetical protein n=1 Tax=Streptomyces TaxID=1883 RepID=UPI0029B17D4E|nr:hypothetical protein [Streptomyces sp. ME02-6979.5a]MDX3343794.1 hypothetical protein [Streptomyces sp. ME02-6979.5a]